MHKARIRGPLLCSARRRSLAALENSTPASYEIIFPSAARNGTTHRLLHQTAKRTPWTRRAPLRHRTRPQNLRKHLATGLEPVDRILQNAPERIPPEPGPPRRPVSNRAPNGTILLR